MKYHLNQNELVILMPERIDALSAPDLEVKLQEIFSKETFSSLILDFDETSYISSAGLRVILRTKRNYKNFRIINTTTDVYEIFDMTGFTQMMTIEKAYRKVSIDGCDLIGEGANGKIYRISEDTIVKVYDSVDALPDIKRERNLARIAFVAGIPTAISYDIVRVGQRYGSVFELLEAKSFAKLVATDTANLDEYIKLYVNLVKQLHETEVDDAQIPDMKDLALSWVHFLENHLEKEDYDKLLSLVENVPDEKTLLHGDYHLKNIMMQGNEVMLIDMDTLCHGDPVFELGSIWLAYQGFPELDHQILQDFMGIPFEIGEKIWKETLNLYFTGKSEEEKKEYEKKAKIVGYMRNLRRTIRRNPVETEESKKIIENCKEKLHLLLQEIASLSYRV